jgi:D-alanyl-D-alanine carboxypeptidase
MRLAFLAIALLGAGPPQFEATVSRVTAAELGRSWRPGCPVAPSGLRRVRLRHWGFDGRARTGALVVAASVAPDVVTVFRRLYEARFPIRRLRPIAAYSGDDNRSMAADNTSAFNYRYAVATGPRRWSSHAYGTAIDVNPLENPYVLGRQVLPPRGAAYLDRIRARPGMALRGGVLVRAFASVGWQWGGRWAASPDYQHFSATGG